AGGARSGGEVRPWRHRAAGVTGRRGVGTQRLFPRLSHRDDLSARAPHGDCGAGEHERRARPRHVAAAHRFRPRAPARTRRGAVSTPAARWRALGAGERLMAIEAAAWLTLASCVVRALPFRVYSRLLGRPAPAVRSACDVPSAPAVAQGGANAPVAPAADSRARAVALALGRAANHLHWPTTCLVRVVAGAL